MTEQELIEENQRLQDDVARLKDYKSMYNTIKEESLILNGQYTAMKAAFIILAERND